MEFDWVSKAYYCLFYKSSGVFNNPSLCTSANVSYNQKFYS